MLLRTSCVKACRTTLLADPAVRTTAVTSRAPSYRLLPVGICMEWCDAGRGEETWFPLVAHDQPCTSIEKGCSRCPIHGTTDLYRTATSGEARLTVDQSTATDCDHQRRHQLLKHLADRKRRRTSCVTLRTSRQVPAGYISREYFILGTLSSPHPLPASSHHHLYPCHRRCRHPAVMQQLLMQGDV